MLRIRDLAATRIRIIREQNIDQYNKKIILKFSERRLFLVGKVIWQNYVLI